MQHIYLFFDIDGVLYQGDSVIEGAADTIDWCIAHNIPHLFLTNTTSKPRIEICEKLNRLSIMAKEQDILTPPTATKQWLKTHISAKANIALFVPEKTRSEFNEFNIIDNPAISVDAVIIGDMGDSWNYQLLNNAFLFLMQTPPPDLIALGMTRYWTATDGLRLDTAPFVSALECASDISAKVLGKPSNLFFQTGLNILSATKENSYMIGDDIKGDIDGAQKTGIKGILVKTGKFRNTDLDMGIVPDLVISSIKALPTWLECH